MSEGFGPRLEAFLATPESAPVAPAPAPPRRVSNPVTCTREARGEWEVFKRRFMPGDGRVVDTGNGGVSHSEGQGWGMLLAVAFDDQVTFDAVHGWTTRNLRRPGDHLHAWRFLPQAAQPVPDSNNATDADLFIAAALWRASWRWGRPELAREAQAVARDILRLAVREVGGRTVLLPGAAGFEQTAALTINPSYYVFPALEELASLAPSPVWARLQTDGRALLGEARFGRWKLPPDWLRLDRHTGALSPHPNWPARFSYDAIRVPLWLAWSEQKPDVVSQSFSNYWTLYKPIPPAWVDLNTNVSATYPAPSGMVAIGHIATALTQPARKARVPDGFPALHASPDYYSAALIMLSRCAWQESCDT